MTMRPLARPLLFDLVTVAGSLAASCLMPFAGLAAAAALTMRRRDAVATLIGGWALNQAIGYGLLGFPTDPATIVRGILTGLCALAALFVAAKLGGSWRVQLWRAPLAFAAAFVAYELLLYVADASLGDTSVFTPKIIWLVARNDALWFAGLIAIDALLRTGRRRIARQPA